MVFLHLLLEHAVDTIMCTRSIWVEIITMLYHICYAMVEPSIKIHIYETLCETGNFTSDCSELNSADNTIVLEDSIQKYAANSLVLMKCMRSIPALLIIIFCGAWSDDIGRKVGKQMRMGFLAIS